MTKEIWDEHPLVFHYTSQTGLQGILQSQTLHATHYKYLNDAQEIRQLLPRLVEQITPFFKKPISSLAKFNSTASETIKRLGGLQAAAAHEAEAIVKGLYKATFSMTSVPNFYEPFIISFCSHENEYEKENGLLSQWRAYGGHEGCAVVFNTNKLANVIKAETQKFAYNQVHISSVVYDNDTAKFMEEFQSLTEALGAIAPRLFENSIPPHLFDQLFGPFINSATRFKHRGFSEEREVRIVLPPISKFWREKLRTDQPEDFRKKIDGREIKVVNYKDNLSPYIAVGEYLTGTLPIEYIIVGPGTNKKSRGEKLNKYLELHGLPIKVKISDTPLI